ncbi:MAG: 2-aminoethylphosphonate--pyruvate transaminase [Alphaproteobacteria bacterium]|jgi:2-aminoethylphosphonate-pyruvate transaminase|nr:2-aminoethylphosphonate--pyruvate transaminase [Alphaproteobacteria bacterium]MDP6516565.1 2-aminoethylphosphonate--pyruvate transaminase [Alphaproteobacteria bacterium]
MTPPNQDSAKRARPAQAPVLLTPGPLTTSAATKQAMLRDWGSRDEDFIALTGRVRARLAALAGATSSHTCIPLQGSGTFAVEAMIGSLVPRSGKILVLVNGAYGRRIERICRIIARPVATLTGAETRPIDPAALASALAADAAISHVAAVHCETTSGVLNPLAEIAAVTAAAGRALLIDAMSSLGAIELDARAIRFEAVAASANKCLEGVPGLGFVLADAEALAANRGAAPSLSLDLHDQWQGLEKNGQWRFTPPTHVLAALDAALDQLEVEGGVAARHARYTDNCTRLVAGMRGLGFETLLADADQAPIIVTFAIPGDPRFEFGRFYQALHERGIVIYPGKLTDADSFRIGCIGAIGAAEIDAALAAVATVLDDMGVRARGPA